jgi:hypothetical protein
MPATLANLPLATRILLKGTSCDSDVKTLMSLVQLDVAPESMIHCESPLVPLTPKMSLANVGNKPCSVAVIVGTGTAHSMHKRSD